MYIHDIDDAVFYPVVNENQGLMFTNVSGGSITRSSFGFPFGYYWSGGTVGNFVENRFYGDICLVYFFGDTGSVTVTVNGNNILTDVPVTSFNKVGAYRILQVTGLNVDYNIVRITVTATTVNIVGMMVHKLNAPFMNLTSTSSFNVTNTLNSTISIYSTTTPLAANGSVTSSFVDLEQVPRTINWILVTIFSDQSGTLNIEFSNDNSNVDAVQTINYTGNTRPYIQPIARCARYVRVRYVNGSTAQTTFRLYVRGISSSL
jgi:hypothetical protein